MPRALQRKLTDVTTGEELLSVQEALEAKRIPMQFHLHTRKNHEFFRVYVYISHLREARQALEVS